MLRGHRDDVFAVAFHHDGTRLATAGGDRSVSLWDLARGQKVARLPGHSSVVRSLAFSPDGATLASGSLDTTIRLWNTSPLRGRYDALSEVEAVRPQAARLVSRLMAELGEKADVASQLHSDDSLSPVLRRTALGELMDHSGSQGGLRGAHTRPSILRGRNLTPLQSARSSTDRSFGLQFGSEVGQTGAVGDSPSCRR